MGDLVIAAHRFLPPTRDQNLEEQIVDLAKKYTHFPEELFSPITDAVRHILSDKRFPQLEISQCIFSEIAYLLCNSTARQAEAVLMDSYISFCKLEGWDPMGLPACKKITRFYKHYLFIRQTVCVATLLVMLSEPLATMPQNV